MVCASVIKMKPTCAVIVVSAHAAFLITFTILCTIWKKLKRKPWSNMIIALIISDLFLQALDLIYTLEFRSGVLGLISIGLPMITRFGILIVGDNGKKVMKMIIIFAFSLDFILALYDMAFVYPNLNLIQFWICAVRGVTNGSVILCLCSSCANPGFQEEKTSPRKVLFMQMHRNNVMSYVNMRLLTYANNFAF